ncbi:MAG: pirin family protein [Cyclobacteriaceae bacterium]|nr:pirin family protein [Cyclobacteriaceae bacterium]
MANPILRILPLGFPWQTQDPFLFCVHHMDAYPKGNEHLGPTASLAGRNIGQDFTVKDGWRMYHGSRVPGFPSHPHRGFETVTIVQKGFIDHSDSLGAAARFGNGDVQWMTAGKGIQHSEMFPLLSTEHDNPLELFQIWLNLPRAGKLVEPYFQMIWSEQIPLATNMDGQGKKTTVKIVAGVLDDHKGIAPPPDSWAANTEHDLAIWIITMEPEATWTLPKAKEGVNRNLYFFEGASIAVGDHEVPAYKGIVLDPDQAVPLKNGATPGRLLLLHGVSIKEPVVQHGPFVMNTEAEIRQTFLDYQKTQFGGWPWPSNEPVHPRNIGRFAKYVDGREEARD